MTVKTAVRQINRHVGIHALLALFFGLCWLIHNLAFTRLKMDPTMLHDRTAHSWVLVGYVAENFWLAIAFILLAFGSVAFLQFRNRAPWTYWLTALLFCIPCIVYWIACARVLGKLVSVAD
jgi:hypothetical protein